MRQDPILFVNEVLFLGGSTLLIFVPNYFGNMLKVKSEEFVDDVYDCCFYEQNLKFKKMFLIFLHNVQEPWIIKYNGIFGLSLEYFVEVSF